MYGISADAATFDMNGGEISGNSFFGSSDKYGGGVYVDYDSTFTMRAGKISGNNARRGGGVSVGTSGTFKMHGGEISGNTTVTDSGGVYIKSNSTLFTKAPESGTGSTTSGVIYGYMETDPKGNLVGTRKEDGTPATHTLNKGDAVYNLFGVASNGKYRTSTLGAEDHISSTDKTNPLWDNHD
jgi:hypothetical protein